MNTKENRRSLMTRRIFREALTELMLEKGFARISVNEICVRADLNRSTFYAHYADQYDLLREIEDEFLKRVEKIVLESDMASFMQKFQAYLSYLYQNGSLFLLLIHADADFRARVIQSAFRLYGLRRESGMITEEDPKVAEKLYFMSGGSLLLLEKWIASELTMTEEEMAERLGQLWTAINEI